MIKNKKFLITGHTSGLGRSLNKILLENKNTIIGISKSKSKIRNFIDLQVDFSNLKILNNKLNKLNKINKIDYLILNAGLLGDLNLFSKVNFKKFERILNVNFLSNKIIIDYFLSKNVKIKNVICISSGAALKPKYAWGSYCISKAALASFTKCLREEERANSIRACTITLGAVNTPLWDSEDVASDFNRNAMLTSDSVSNTILYIAEQPHTQLIEDLILMPATGAF